MLFNLNFLKDRQIPVDKCITISSLGYQLLELEMFYHKRQHLWQEGGGKERTRSGKDKEGETKTRNRKKGKRKGSPL